MFFGDFVERIFGCSSTNININTHVVSGGCGTQDLATLKEYPHSPHSMITMQGIADTYTEKESRSFKLAEALADYESALALWIASFRGNAQSAIAFLAECERMLTSGNLSMMRSSFCDLVPSSSSSSSSSSSPSSSHEISGYEFDYDETQTRDCGEQQGCRDTELSSTDAPKGMTEEQSRETIHRSLCAWSSTVKSLVDSLPRHKRATFTREIKIATTAAALRASTGDERAGKWGKELPVDVLVNIFGRMTTDDAARAARVCVAWKRAHADDRTWKGLFRGRWCARQGAEERIVRSRMRRVENAITHGRISAESSLPNGSDERGRQKWQQEQQESEETEDSNHVSPHPSTWRAHFRLVAQAISEFNIKAGQRDGMASLEPLINSGVLEREPSPEGIATCLLDLAGLSFRAISQFLCRRGEPYRSIRDLYVDGRLDFQSRGSQCSRPLDALRIALSLIHLPRESNQISLLLRSISRVYDSYYSEDQNDAASAEGVYVLFNAMLMVNTVMHNRAIPEADRIPLDAVRKSMEGLNDGENFSDQTISTMYDEIRNREFVFMCGSYSRPAMEVKRRGDINILHSNTMTLAAMQRQSLAEARARRR